MITLVKRTNEERRELFRNTADKMGLQDAIIEKDFWVCYTLDYLFHRSPWKKALAFKGGTSLSKAFGLIQRFSEDIDLILDWRILGFELHEPWNLRTKNKQDVFNKEANARAANFLLRDFCPQIKAELSIELGQEAQVSMDEMDAQTVLFAYPSQFSHTATLRVIRLEIGALAAWTPAVWAKITPYVATHYPALFDQPATNVLTVAPERTFWEKATILHHEAHRPESLAMPSRYSRHYYDLYQLALSGVKDAAISQPEMLRKVVEFKMKFYPRAWARYEDVLTGGLKLIPPSSRLDALAEDYAAMKEMLFGKHPSFENILAGLQALEQEIISSYAG